MEMATSTRQTSSQRTSPWLRIGVCGFCVPQRELFQRFRLLEVQQTFYWPPQVKTVERWRQTAPDDFEFTLKAFQAITHSYNHRTYRKAKFSADECGQCGNFRDTPVIRAAWEQTRILSKALDATVVVFQCPPSFTETDENVTNLRAFFNWAERDDALFAWEPRHATWTPELIAELCSELDLIHAVDPFEQQSAAGSPRYFRLHGKALGNYRYGYNYPYSDNELHQLMHLCSGQPTYCLFNNMQMAADVHRFTELMNSSGAATSG
jgi:uncharacterized protein YecE (DUF72 family)